ncbi:uncharacterized protein METZ01_LOCUS143469, partial [marine metagenome]
VPANKSKTLALVISNSVEAISLP